MFRKIALVLAAPLLLIAACANEADEQGVQVKTGDAAVSALRAAPDAVAEAGTAQVEVVMAMTMMGDAVEVTASGAVDAAAEQMRMEMDMGALFDQLAASTGEEVPAGLGGTMEMVADGSTFYLRAPMFSMMGVDGWISMTPEDLGTTAEGLGFGAGAYDLTQTLESLRGVAGEPEVVGQEEVRGVDTTHYRATMNLAQALEEAPPEQRERLEVAFEQLGGGDELGDVDVPVDVWIDADDLPRRMRMDMGSVFAAAGLGDGTMTMTMDMFGYGEPVEIEVPSPDEATPIREAFGGLEGGGFGS
jgi:hypothetical protein